MLNIKNKVLISLLIFLFSISVYAQRRGPGHMSHPDSGRFMGREDGSSNTRFDRRREKLEKLKVWEMVEYLGLSSQQSEKFFPEYRQYKERLQKNRENIESISIKLDNKLSSEEYDPDEKEFDTYLKKLEKIKEKRFELKKEFLKEVDNFLNTKQKLKLLIFEYKFKRQIMHEMHKMHGRGK